MIELPGRLIHYSARPLDRIVSRKHDENQCGVYKTPGLWVSVQGEYDWLYWCLAESYELNNFKCATEVHLRADANVLVLRNAFDIDDFTAKFIKQTHEFTHIGREIDWLSIRERWSGLIIAPYVWERRLTRHTSWYYGWDCASGVIWDANAIDRIEAVEPPDLNREAA